jgi:hypothetical protein
MTHEHIWSDWIAEHLPKGASSRSEEAVTGLFDHEGNRLPDKPQRVNRVAFTKDCPLHLQNMQRELDEYDRSKCKTSRSEIDQRRRWDDRLRIRDGRFAVQGHTRRLVWLYIFHRFIQPDGRMLFWLPRLPSVPAKSDNHDNGTTGFHTIRRIYRVGLDPAFRLYAAGFDWCRTRTIHLGDAAGRVCRIGIHRQETTATLQLSALV